MVGTSNQSVPEMAIERVTSFFSESLSSSWLCILLYPFKLQQTRHQSGGKPPYQSSHQLHFGGNLWTCHMGLSENSVPLNPMVNDHYPYEKLLFHWEYTLFSDKPIYKPSDKRHQTHLVGVVGGHCSAHRHHHLWRKSVGFLENQCDHSII